MRMKRVGEKEEGGRRVGEEGEEEKEKEGGGREGGEKERGRVMPTTGDGRLQKGGRHTIGTRIRSGRDFHQIPVRHNNP